MMNYCIEVPDAPKQIFETEKQYYAFLSAWKSFHNSPAIKGEWKKVEGKSYRNPGIKYSHFIKQTPLDAVHYILYNLIRGKPTKKGFYNDPNQRLRLRFYDHLIGRPTTLDTYERAFKSLLYYLKTIENNMDLEWADGYPRLRGVDYKTPYDYASRSLLIPFGNTLTKKHMKVICSLVSEEATLFKIRGVYYQNCSWSSSNIIHGWGMQPKFQKDVLKNKILWKI